MRNLGVQNPVDFTKGKWAFAYESRNRNQADNVYNTMLMACGRLELNVEEPEWIEVGSLAKID